MLNTSKTSTKSGLKFQDFEDTINNQKTGLFILTNSNGVEAAFTNYGQRLVSLMIPDKNGEFCDVVFGFSTIEDYINSKEKYIGAIIGRYANRISNGSFFMDHKSYRLTVNEGKNQLHGGEIGFSNVIWDTQQLSDKKIIFTYVSKHLEEGYPGNLRVKVTYELTNENELKIYYEGVSDQNTVVNLTNHSYFNLKGAGSGTINGHVVEMNSSYYTVIDENMIPTGKIDSVINTPLDFKKPKRIGDHLNDNHDQIRFANGYDHNFVIDPTKNHYRNLVLAAKINEPTSGRMMAVYTDKPGFQFYTTNVLNTPIVGKKGKEYFTNYAFCIEPQYFPDSPNRSEFPSVILKKDQIYKTTTIFKFLYQK